MNSKALTIKITMAPQVTWLLPVRNGLPFLEETLASIEAQTFRDFEVLAWDNASDDGSVEQLNEWIPARLPGRVVIDQPFDTLGGCLRAMVDASESPLLARIDADDVNEPQRLERQVALMNANPKVDGLASWATQINAQGAFWHAMNYTPTTPWAMHWSLFLACSIIHPTMIIRRDALLAAGNYSDMSQSQDYDLWLRLVAAGQVTALGEQLLKYRRHGNNISLKYRGNWEENNRTLAKKYATQLFPGTEVEDLMRVRDYFSHESPIEGKNPPSRVLVLSMIEQLCQMRGWDVDEVVRQAPFPGILAKCSPRSPKVFLRMNAQRWLRPSPSPIKKPEGR